ncbi:methyltetrahydroprotoberberine 14-monooxygenase-like [Hibiscus syriacus]|uniref:methyltetrahydroprotoberberine 14-monooxygenase-like n=1 Tax=Hibiscus syriacus TaxID=106335 RepID=UPI001920B1AC|nr:methyltetrahydroprotoberberine 14-monooxygenase-like [Hibiscus syriacus]
MACPIRLPHKTGLAMNQLKTDKTRVNRMKTEKPESTTNLATEFITINGHGFLHSLSTNIVFTLLVPRLIFGAISRAKSNQKDNKKPPPELAGGRPLLGHLHLFGKGQLIHRKLGSLADEYGLAFLIRMGIHPTLVVSSWDVIKECFTTNDKVFQTGPRFLTAKIMGYDHASMASAPYSPYWSHTREIAIVELLSNRRLELLKHICKAEINAFLKQLYNESAAN